MQALSIAFHAIVPLFLIIAVGYAVKRLGWIGPEEVRRFNKVTFYTFMPVMLFYNIYTSDFSQAVRLPYVLLVVGAALSMVLIATVVTLLAEKTPQRRGVMIQAAFRSNFVLLGLPIAMELLPGGNLGVTALMIAIVVPIFNILSVVILEYFRGGTPKLKEVLLAVGKNPLIIGSLAGLLVQALHVSLPDVLVSFAVKMNSAATPLILLLLGASFEARKLSDYKKELAVCVGLRLVIFPGAILTLAMLLGIRDTEFVTLLAMCAAPTAVNTQDQLVSVQKNADGSGTLVFQSGATLPFSSAKSMTATAYTAGHGGADTVTATGTVVRMGTVAVDKRVIPLGTKMYIVTNDGLVYGMAVAEDTGVRGNTVDLYYDTYQQCINFGRRSCTVYILE